MSLEQELRDSIELRIDRFLNEAECIFSSRSEDVARFLAPARRLAAGGKRMRAILMFTGYRAAAGGLTTLPDSVIDLAAALELFQAAALVHDDIIDQSDSRRGHPATHVAFAGDAPEGSLEDPQTFGKNAAILLGDLLLMVADRAAARAFRAVSPPSLQECRAVWDEMTAEVAIGQYFDVVNSTLPLSAHTPEEALSAALRVVRHKSARYSVEHPLVLGAHLGGAEEELVASLRAIGAPLGEAFQLRDDVLGVFGDPNETGKPAGDDLRQGKRTPLIALTRQLGNEDDMVLLHANLGDRSMEIDTVRRLQGLMRRVGAVDAHEKLIEERLRTANTALNSAPIANEIGEILREHAQALAYRIV